MYLLSIYFDKIITWVFIVKFNVLIINVSGKIWISIIIEKINL